MPLFETPQFDALLDDVGGRLKTLFQRDEPAAASSSAAPASDTPVLPDFLQKRRRSLNLTALNPSLANVGVAVCETLMPRYLDKAGVSCERMQHAGLPLEFITLLLSAVFGAQDEGELRRVFELFDASGDGCLDEEEFLAMVPMLGEDVPPEWLGKLFEVIDGDGNSVVTYDEFVKFVRLCNPRGDNDGAPLAADEASGWRALVKGVDHDEKVVLQVARRRSGGAKAGWRSVAMGDLKHLERLGALPIARVDNENAEAVVDRLREMRMPDHQVLAIVRAVFVTQTDEDYAKVFDIFDTDSTGGIDQGEFHQIAALLGERTTLQELRELFIAADRDCNGLLDVDEFSALLRTLSPKMKDKAEAQGARLLVARERLQQRVGEVFGEGRASDEPPTATCKAIVLGASRSGKTYLLNQVLATKLPKGKGTTVGFGTVPVAIGASRVAVQVFDAPGDPRFAPLGEIFYTAAHFAILVYDSTSTQSFDAVDAYRLEWLKANPQYDEGRLMVVGNVARAGVKRAISAGFARDYCSAHGSIACFDVDESNPQGIMDPIKHLATEFLFDHPADGVGVHTPRRFP